MKKQKIAALVTIALSLSSCAGAGDTGKPEPEPLSAQEIEAIRSLHYVDVLTYELIGRYGGRPLVRVYFPGGTEAGKARYDAAGVAIRTSSDWKDWTLALYDIAGEGEETRHCITDSIRHELRYAYLEGLMSREDVIDARERLISLGLALPDSRSPAPLTDDEFSGIESAYTRQVGRRNNDIPLIVELVGRYSGHPMVFVAELYTAYVEAPSIEIGGLIFDFILPPESVFIYDGSELVILADAYGSGLIGGDELADARDNLSLMWLVYSDAMFE